MVQLNKSSRMNKLSQFLVINIIGIAVTLDYDTRCPNAGEWRFRGKKFSCGRTQYVCLLHSLRNVYHENCDGLDYSITGSKLIFQPYFDKALCSRNRFQPFPFSTNGNSECVYSKSFCSEKGQYVFHKGNLISDITCGCDLSSGYEFVSKPKHDCYCIPSEEDCSCHKLLCYEKDEQCPHDDDVIKTKRSTDDNMITKLQENDTNKFTYSNKGINLRSLTRAVFTTLLVAMIICGSVYVKIGIYGKPKTPSNLEVIDVSDTSITISWDFVNKSEKKNRLYCKFSN